MCERASALTVRWEQERMCQVWAINAKQQKSNKQKNSTKNKNLKKIYVCWILIFQVFFFCSTITGTLWDSLGCTGRTKTLLGRFTLSESSEERSYVLGSLKIPIWGWSIDLRLLRLRKVGAGPSLPLIWRVFSYCFCLLCSFLVFDLIFKCSVTVRVEELVLRYVTLCWVLFVFCFVFGFAFNVNIHVILFNITFSKTLQDTVERDALRYVALRYALCYCSVICYMT